MRIPNVLFYLAALYPRSLTFYLFLLFFFSLGLLFWHLELLSFIILRAPKESTLELGVLCFVEKTRLYVPLTFVASIFGSANPSHECAAVLILYAPIHSLLPLCLTHVSQKTRECVVPESKLLSGRKYLRKHKEQNTYICIHKKSSWHLLWSSFSFFVCLRVVPMHDVALSALILFRLSSHLGCRAIFLCHRKVCVINY